MKVKNMESPKTGKSIPNQFIIHVEDGVYFQSYNSIIAFIPAKRGKVQLDTTFWNYSKTTSKYRNEFLKETTKDTLKKIESGEYELTNLN